MKIFNKIEFKLSIVIILALLLQVFMPVIENYVYAREEVEAEDIEAEMDEFDEVDEPDNPVEDAEYLEEDIEEAEEVEEEQEDVGEGESTVKPLARSMGILSDPPKDLGDIFTSVKLLLNEDIA
ncbi:MAG: hypothetical protein GX329_00495 [Tissierellia bacterium]|nr:hypothetical protein [Tissierellia bacterium]